MWPASSPPSEMALDPAGTGVGVVVRARARVLGRRRLGQVLRGRAASAVSASLTRLLGFLLRDRLSICRWLGL